MQSLVNLLLIVLCFSFCAKGFPQSKQQPFEKIPPALLRQDLRTLKDSLTAFHPGMFRYTNRNSLNRLFDSTINAQDEALSTIDIYTTVRYLLSAVKDGHTKAFLPTGVQSLLEQETKMFPAHLYLSAEKTYLPCDAFGLPAGTEIISIDNTPIAHIRKKLLQYLRSDGSIITKKYWDINYGDSPFPYLYYLVYGEKESFTIRYRLPSAKIGYKTVQSAKSAERVCIPPGIPDSPTVKTAFINKDLAVLKISAFLNQYPADNYYESLQAFFTDVRQKEIKKLIIDLRDNGGGLDVFGSALYAYLTTSPFPYYRSLHSTQKQFAPADYSNLAIQQPKENAFSGKLYILINGQSFSTTTEFCSIVKTNNRATFIGVETEGGYYGNTSGPSKELRLANSKITVRIPLYQYVMEVKPAVYPDRGIFPDHEVEQTLADILEGKDTQYEFTLKLATSEP